MWSNAVDIRVVRSSAQIIRCEVKSVNSINRWLMTGVYGSPYAKDKTTLWDRLYNLVENIRGPWLMIGYFNALLFSGDKVAGRRVGTSLFRGFMDHIGGIKIEFYGNQFTWDNGRIGMGMIKKRIDSVTCNSSW